MDVTVAISAQRD